MKSHILAQLTFGPWRDDADEEWVENVEEALECFLSSLPRCSQIIGEPVCGVVDSALQARVRLPRLDALAPHHMSRYGRRSLAKLESLLGSTLHVRILADGDETQNQGDWREAKWLVLYGAATDGIAPMRDQEGECVPSYLLPIDADNMERICFWARDEERHTSLWFSGVSLEEEIFTALADPRSSLNSRARELAAMVERATGKPTYTHLFRHYALPGDAETTRPCPLCGSFWKVEGEVFHFRCEPCRLTSNLGPASDQDEHEDELARIGTWRGDS